MSRMARLRLLCKAPCLKAAGSWWRGLLQQASMRDGRRGRAVRLRNAARGRTTTPTRRLISQRDVNCAAAAALAPVPTSGTGIPEELPLFPMQPIGVFLPGMTKTLHLYEPHLISLLEDCLATPHRLMAIAVLEPYMGEAMDGGLGAFVGGYNFMLSCGCLVQVLSAKPYTGGYLVRIRGEGRLGIAALPQVAPYMRAQVYPLPDAAAAAGPAGEAALRRQVEELNDIMRDVQNLASKFRCDETAALQQAMRWLHATPVTPGVLPAAETHGSETTHGSGEAGSTAAAGRGDGAAEAAGASGEDCSGVQGGSGVRAAGDASEGGGGEQSGGGGTGAAAHGQEQRGAGEAGSSSGMAGAGSHQTTAALPHAAAGGARQSGGGDLGAVADRSAAGEEEEEEAFDPEHAVRLSWAALQWVPHASTEERMRMVRTRLLAMETRDVAARLALATEAMGEARAALAARCALKGM